MKKAVVIAACIAWAGAMPSAHDFGNPPTWNKEISRLVYDRCASCHRDGGTAFSLMTYKDMQPRAVAIKQAVADRRMPPWGAVKGFGEFRNDTALTQEQVELFTDWVEGGMLRGNNAKMLPEPPKFDAAPAEPAASSRVTIKGSAVLDRAIDADGLIPVHVPDGASMQIVATLPDGHVTPLVWLYEYKNQYRHPFLFRQPIHLPAGTMIKGLDASSTIDLLETPSMIRRLLSFIPGFAFMFLLVGCSGGQTATPLKEVQRARAGDLDVVVSSSTGALKVGKDTFTIEFRSRSDQKLVDVGTVKISATMVMAGMPPMIGNTTVTPTPTPGRYEVVSDVGMAGSWRLGLEWDGPAGKGSTTLQGKFQ